MKLIKTALKVLLYLLVLEAVLVVHEYGHLREFQRLGVPVREFSLGIGPLLYQQQTGSFALSFRLMPIMAYVAPTDEGWSRFLEQGSLLDKAIVNTAGVRNNALLGLAIVFLLQVLGYLKGNMSAWEFAKTAVVTPAKFLLRFFAFLIGCATLGRVNLADRFLLSTGGINPPKPVRWLVRLNLVLGLINLAPVPPLDGGHLAQAILRAAGVGIAVPGYVDMIMIIAFFMVIGEQDTRVLEIEPENASAWSGERAAEKTRGTAWNFSPTTDISFTDIPLRVRNLLHDAGIHTVGELREATAGQLLQIRGFGPKSLAEVEGFLSEAGLSLRSGDVNNNAVK